MGFPDLAQIVKNLPTMQETRFDPWVSQIFWGREWLPTPVFLPGQFHGQRSLADYSPWSRKGSAMTERLTLSPPSSSQSKGYRHLVSCVLGYRKTGSESLQPHVSAANLGEAMYQSSTFAFPSVRCSQSHESALRIK